MFRISNYAMREILLGILWLLTLTSGDFLMELLSYRVFKFDFRIIFGVYILGVLLYLSKSPVFYLIVGIMFIMDLLQLPFISYFGRALGAEDIFLIFHNFDDVISEGINRFSEYWFILPFVLIMYLVPILVRKFIRINGSNIASVLAICLFLFTSIRAFSLNIS